MNIRPEIIKLIEENTGSKFPNISLGNDFLDLTPKAKATKDKQVGLHQTRKFLHSKGNHLQNENATYRMGETIFKSCN